MDAMVPVNVETYKLGFFGAGKMAESIARGSGSIRRLARFSHLYSSSLKPLSPRRLPILRRQSPPLQRRCDQSINQFIRVNFCCVIEFGLIGCCLKQVVEDSDVVVFSVKPPVVKGVIVKLRPLLTKKKLLVSVAAGVKLKDLQERAGHNRFVRVMPNIPAAIGVAASVMSLGGGATEEDGELIAKIFGSVGKIWSADEKLFDAITGLSGPAYIYLAIEALADGGVAAGLRISHLVLPNKLF